MKMRVFGRKQNKSIKSRLAEGFRAAGEPAQIRVKVGVTQGRSYLANVDFIQKKVLRKEARNCQRVLKCRIHPMIFGSVKKRGLNKALTHVILWKDCGRPITKLDNKRAFRSVDKRRSDSRLTKMGLLPFSEAIRYVTADGNQVHVRGLPEGQPQCPVLLADYLTPVMKRISKQFNALFYGDDLYLALDTPDQHLAAISTAKAAYSRNSCKERIMQIHEDGPKAPRLFNPNDPLRFGGVELVPGYGILPDPSKSARHYVRTLANQNKLAKKYAANPQYKRICEWTKKFCPLNHLNSEGRLSELGVPPDSTDDQEFSLESPSNLLLPTTLSSRVGMDTQGVSAANFVGLGGGALFSFDHKNIQREIFKRVNQDPTHIRQLYLRQKDAPFPFVTISRKGTEIKSRHPFWDLAEELNLRFIGLSLFHRKCLTSTFSPASKKLTPDLIQQAYRKYNFELDAINNEYNQMARIFDRKYIDGLGMRRAKIQQFLRGVCHLRWLDIRFGKHEVPPSIVKALGILVHPVEVIMSLKQSIAYWQMGILTVKQFESVMQAISDTLKNDDFVIIETIVSDVTGRDRQELVMAWGQFRGHMPL